MTTPAQIAANRRNAQRSTGPKTRRGKATAARNALRHGLLATDITLPDEDAAAFAAFRSALTTECAPHGPLEALLVDRVTACAWRLRRVVRVEATWRTTEAHAARADAEPAGDPVAAGVIRDGTGADALSKLSRYETALERGLYRALHELQRLQAARRGHPVRAPAVVEVEVSTPGA